MTRQVRLALTTFVRWGSLAALLVINSCSSDAGKADAATDGPQDSLTEAGSEGGVGGQGGGGMDASPDTGVAGPSDSGVADASDAGMDVPADAPGSTDAPNNTDAPGNTDTGGPDVPVPTTLTVTVADRRQTSFQLVWPAPATAAGGAVAGYDIRVAKVAITAANIDDAAVTRMVAYTGTPRPPGQADGVIARDLNIEQDYFFAVVGKDGSGTRGTLMATTTPVAAAFVTTILPGTGTDGIGIDVNGSGDFGGTNRSFTADGRSDLIVGGTGGTHVYLYFGTTTGYSTTPSVTFTGTASNFGQAVVDAGDMDGDGLDDIAIASPSDGGGKIFVFSRKNPPASWGTTGAWPVMLMDTQANYTFTVDATFAGGTASIFRRSLTPLGNFDGTGASDLAVGVRLHSTSLGSVVIIKGSSSLASLTIPDVSGAGTIQIDGIVASAQFGMSVLGIGQFFPAPAGPALVVSAPPAGAVYAFRGQAPTAVLTAGSADDSVVAAASADQYGVNLGFLGALGGSPGALTIASTAGKYVDVHLGTAAAGPLLGAAGGAPAATVRFGNSASGNSFGIVNLGGGIKGTARTASLIGGDAVSDLVVAGLGEAGVPIYIVNGATLSTMSGNVDVAVAQAAVVSPIVKIANRLPSPWSGHAGAAMIIDSNSDGYADFAIGESAFGVAGRVVVFH